MPCPQLKFYYEHRDEILKYRADYYEENKEKINERSKHYFKQYYEKNKETLLEKMKNKYVKKPRQKINKKKIELIINCEIDFLDF